MGGSELGYRYSVERELVRPGFLDVALVRREVHRGALQKLRHRNSDGGTVVFHRTFREMLELAKLGTYAAVLDQVAVHANAGTLCCFVETKSEHAAVEVTLYERWFDGQRLRCDELAHRVFDPGDESALVASAEFVAELEAWAERRNEEREAAYIDASADDAARTQQATEQQSAAEELARILAGETGS